MRYAIVIDIDEEKAEELMEKNQLPDEREVVLQQIDWGNMVLVDARVVSPYFRPVEPVANLIWTEDDVIGIMEDAEIELSDWNINRAVRAVNESNLAYVQGNVNEELVEIVSQEFEGE
jgi:hypothetical protein